jgi:hypothetical protein
MRRSRDRCDHEAGERRVREGAAFFFFGAGESESGESESARAAS